MTSIRPFLMEDVLKFNAVNLDTLTETFGLTYYMQYLANWPRLMTVAEAPNGQIMGYMMGKAEGLKTEWHGHVSAVTVNNEYRRIGLAARLMDQLEAVSDQYYKGYFVDLFVRVNNTVAVKMYTKLGYSVYRRVIGYYADEEDAFGTLSANCRQDNREE